MSKSSDKKARVRKTLDAVNEDVLSNALSLSILGSELRRITNVSELLHDRETLLKIAEVVAGGGSIHTAEMAIGIHPGMLKTWLQIGKTDAEDGLYRALYRFYLAAASEARRAAEASLLMRNPAKWLETCDPLNQLSAITNDVPLDGKAAKKKGKQSFSEDQEDASNYIQFKDFD
jgi:hypothetical protein